MHLRKDIQILRGLSVMLVVLFHLGIGSIDSGYLGVDIFFVISGFLMAVLYNKDKKVDFFIKRAKRLLPAYFVTIILVFVVAVFITTPTEFNSVVEQSIYATLFSSNTGYWLVNSYFSKAEFNPLLHLWSLGVEIQFYLIIPFLYWAFRKNKYLLPVFFIFSLLACFLIISISPKTSFFMMPLRLWEFLIGFFVATYLTTDGAVNKNRWAWLGAFALTIIIGIPAMNVDGQALSFTRGHPGIYALIVSLATGIILALGIPKIVEDSKLGIMFEKVGKYSYSIYLVHFPVIVLYLYKPLSGTILVVDGLGNSLILIVSILVLSVLMYHFVESSARTVKHARQWLIAIPCIILVCYFVGPVVQQSHYTAKEMLIFDAWTDRSHYRCGKIIRVLHPTALSCEITSTTKKPAQRILLVGDSHADSIKTTFAAAAENLNTSVRFIVSNNPLKQGGLDPEHIVNEALSNNISSIVLHYSPNSIDPAIIKNFIKLIKLAKDNGIVTSYIMPVPDWDEHVPKTLWKNITLAEQLQVQLLSDYENENKDLYEELLAIKSKKFTVYTVGNIFCKKRCLMIDESGRPLYFDTGHLTLTGSKYLANLFDKIIKDGISLKISEI